MQHSRSSAWPNVCEVRAILDEICEGTLAPGTHLVQEQLAERLGGSHQPIQQAMALMLAGSTSRRWMSR